MNRVFKSDIQNLINKKKMKAFSYFRKKNVSWIKQFSSKTFYV